MDPERSDEIHPRDYFKVINKHRGMVITIMLVTFAVAAFGTFSVTPQYSASTKVMIESAGSNNLTDSRNYSPYDPEFYETQIQLIQSQQVGRRVVELLALEKNYDTFFPPEKKSSILQSFKNWLRQLKESILNTLRSAFQQEKDTKENAGPLRSRTDILAAKISSSLEVELVSGSRIFTISFTSANPEFAALIANTAAKAYIDTTLEMKMEATRRTLEWMTQKADQERQKLEKTEHELQNYMRSNNLVTLENRIAVIPEKLSLISTQLVKAQNNRERLEALYGKIKRVAKNSAAVESILGVTNGKTLQTLRDQILKAEQTLRELSNKFGSKHPAMIKAKGDLAILESKKTQEINRLIQSVKNEYELAILDENSLKKQMEMVKAEAHNLNEKYIQYDVYKRETDTNRQLYDALLTKLKEQAIIGETQPVNLWIVEDARVPLAPFKPRKNVNLLIGLLLGLFSGIGMAFVVEYLDQTIQSPDETEAALGVPVLGAVALHKKNKHGPIETVMLDQPHSVIAENYRALRTSLLLSASEGVPRRILVTSAAAGAGKTTTSINLATALAQSGKKVVLIDGDMRKPQLHKHLGLKVTPGLSDYLAGMNDGGILQQTKQDNLRVIVAGPVPPNPSELLMSERAQKLVEKLAISNDFIICDSPPLQAVVDGRILSQRFDGTILVARAKKTTYEVAQKAIKQLKDAKIPVLGLMINAMVLKKNDYYYESYNVAYGDKPQRDLSAAKFMPEKENIENLKAS